MNTLKYYKVSATNCVLIVSSQIHSFNFDLAWAISYTMSLIIINVILCLALYILGPETCIFGNCKIYSRERETE